MQRTLRSLASRCAGAICGTAGGPGGATAASHGVSSSCCSGALPHASHALSTLTAARSRTSGASSSTPLLAGAPHSCWWMLRLGSTPSPSPPTSSAHASSLASTSASTSALTPAATSFRHYAKAAAKGGAAAAAPAAAAGPKRPRTGTTKLYSCRNDRLRHTHEQIWPTMQLTEYESAMFRRNSRLFVVDMGRSLSLRDKFRMGSHDPAAAAGAGMGGGPGEEPGALAAAAAARRKVPYWQARTLLHESNLHLDALGENPRYLRLRRVGSLYATKLQNVRKMRLLLGFQRRNYVQKLYETSLLARGSHRMWKMVCAMEATLPMVATRMGLAEDVVGAVHAVKCDKLYVNGRQPSMPNRGLLAPGDVVGPSAGSVPYFRNVIARSMAPLIEADVIRSYV